MTFDLGALISAAVAAIGATVWNTQKHTRTEARVDSLEKWEIESKDDIKEIRSDVREAVKAMGQVQVDLRVIATHLTHMRAEHRCAECSRMIDKDQA